jgi:signal transduction histidine kinase
VSHELRTPLSIISSSLELSRAAAPQSAGHALQRAADAAVDMRQTLEALLVLGRVQAGVARAESVDVAAIVREVIAAVESMPGACHGPIATHIQPSPTILELPGAVRIVVRNLVENACIHAPGARVDVALAASVLTVRDYGPGIPVAEREHSLEGFVRGSAAMGEGAGLGLAIVQRLCERIGWTLTLEQTPGGGLTASVSFAR